MSWQERSACAIGCANYSDVVEHSPSPDVPTPLLPPTLTEASDGLNRDPGKYLVTYDLTADEKQVNVANMTINFAAFIFQVQNSTDSYFFVKVRYLSG